MDSGGDRPPNDRRLQVTREDVLLVVQVVTLIATVIAAAAAVVSVRSDARWLVVTSQLALFGCAIYLLISIVRRTSLSRRTLLITGLNIGLLVATLWSWNHIADRRSARAFEQQAAQTFSVIIARFDGPEPKKYGIQRFIAETLDDTATGAEVRVTERILRLQSDALRLREDPLQPTVVIWGAYSVPPIPNAVVSVRINVSIVRPITVPAGAGSLLEDSSFDLPSRVPRPDHLAFDGFFEQSQLATFELQGQLAGAVASITHAIAGVSSYSRSNLKSAIAHFRKAIQLPSTPTFESAMRVWLARSLSSEVAYQGPTARIEPIDQAIQELDRATLLTTTLGPAYSLRAFLYLHRAHMPGGSAADLRRALADLNTLIDLEAHQGELDREARGVLAIHYIIRAGLREQIERDIELSLEDIRHAIDILPAYGGGYLARAITIAESDPKAALRDASRGIAELIEARRSPARLPSFLAIPEALESALIMSYSFRASLYASLGDCAESSHDYRNALNVVSRGEEEVVLSYIAEGNRLFPRCRPALQRLVAIYELERLLPLLMVAGVALIINGWSVVDVFRRSPDRVPKGTRTTWVRALAVSTLLGLGPMVGLVYLVVVRRAGGAPRG